MNKVIRVTLSPDAEEVYKYLNEQAPTSKIERSILNAFHTQNEATTSFARKRDSFPFLRKERSYQSKPSLWRTCC